MQGVIERETMIWRWTGTEKEKEGTRETLNMGRGPGTPGTSAPDLRHCSAGERGYASASSELLRYGNERVVDR